MSSFEDKTNVTTGEKSTGPRLMSRRDLLKMASPLGRVILDKDVCTGCGLCVADCPTGALAVASGDNVGFQLLFKGNICTACGQCVAICPEHCLTLERTLEFGIADSPEVLFEDEIVRCSDCGRPLASRAMINGIRAKLPDTANPAQFELCPECKTKCHPARVRN